MTPDSYKATAKGANNATDPQSWNRYIYVGSDPANRNDPTGQDFCDDDTLFCFSIDFVNGDGGPFGDLSAYFSALAAQIAAQIQASAMALQQTLQSEQCDMRLMGASAVIPGDPFEHTWLQASVSYPNLGVSQTAVLEANAVSKSNPTQQATKVQLLAGQAWLNGGFGTTPLKGSGDMIYNFDQEYTNDQMCNFVTLLGISSASYRNNTVTYNPLSPNSNTFTAYMLKKSGMTVPTGIAFELFFIAPGFYGQMPSNP